MAAQKTAIRRRRNSSPSFLQPIVFEKFQENDSLRCDFLSYLPSSLLPFQAPTNSSDCRAKVRLASPSSTCLCSRRRFHPRFPKHYGRLQFRYTFSSWLHWSRCFSFLRWCFIRSSQQSGICSVLLVTLLFKLEIWVWNRSHLSLSLFTSFWDMLFCIHFS